MFGLYQAEWCPFSAAVRERLTELGIEFVAHQVEPWPEQRRGLVVPGTTEIPVLEAQADGALHVGTRAIFAFLGRFDPPPDAAEHRARYREHAPARLRDATGVLLDRAAPFP